MAKIKIETHGCKLNMADSQAIARSLADCGHRIVETMSEADVFILNSCTVTHIADRKARRALAAAKRVSPGMLVVATGCYAQRAGEKIAELEYVDKVVPNTAKMELGRMLSEMLDEGGQTTSESLVHGHATALGRTRGMVKIQAGCNQVCAYCIVPKVRGREQSIAPELIIAEIERYMAQGCREVVLTGTQLGGYGFDLDDIDLTGLIVRILGETSIERLRVSSIQPQEFSVELLKLWTGVGAGRLCPHFHIPLQSGSDRVLKLMRRRYTREQFVSSVEKVLGILPNAAVTTDVIAGFPSESETDHEQSLKVIEHCGFAGAHVFPYSRRPGTSADYIHEQVHVKLISRRAMQLRAKAERSAAEYRAKMVGEIKPVLWEDEYGLSGLTDNYLRVRLTGHTKGNRLNQIESVRLGEYRRGVVLATPKHRPTPELT